MMQMRGNIRTCSLLKDLPGDAELVGELVCIRVTQPFAEAALVDYSGKVERHAQIHAPSLQQMRRKFPWYSSKDELGKLVLQKHAISGPSGRMVSISLARASYKIHVKSRGIIYVS
jgi:hypothetical protein